jgi:hypothetical protein
MIGGAQAMAAGGLMTFMALYYLIHLLIQIRKEWDQPKNEKDPT